jgi:hypothetical protein
MSDRKYRPHPEHEGHMCGPTRKKRYKSHEDAVAHGAEIFGGNFRAYVCRYCGGWHLTTKPWDPPA